MLNVENVLENLVKCNTIKDKENKKIEKLNKKYPILLWVTEDDDPIFDGVIFERKM